MTGERTWQAIRTVALLLAWELAGRYTEPGRSVLSSPSLIVAQYVHDASLYALHMRATMRSAAAGFIVGNGIAILAAILFCRFWVLEAAFGGVNIALFAMPPIAVGPLLVLIFSGDLPQIILAGLVVYFPTMSATKVGLGDIDPRLTDVIRFYGGGKKQLLRFVRLRSALPSMLAGLRTAASLAVLGAILGEFGSGARWGLGSFLLGSLGEGNPARLWGIGIAATFISLLGYGVFAAVGQMVGANTMAVTIAANNPSEPDLSEHCHRPAIRALLLFVAAVTPFLLWWLILWISGISRIIAPTPLDVLNYLFLKPDASTAQASLIAALDQTLPLAAAGLVCGLSAAFLLAALAEVKPAVAKTLLPIAMLLQTTPLIALTPIVLLVAGRDALASLVMAVLVVFFPAYVILAQGFALVPRAAREVVRAYGGSALRELLLISVPYAAPYVFAAAKLVAPRALLGVMIAEWLLSGLGLGGLLNASRGMLDYEMVWSGAVASILISVLAYQAVAAIEQLACQPAGLSEIQMANNLPAKSQNRKSEGAIR